MNHRLHLPTLHLKGVRSCVFLISLYITIIRWTIGYVGPHFTRKESGVVSFSSHWWGNPNSPECLQKTKGRRAEGSRKNRVSGDRERKWNVEFHTRTHDKEYQYFLCLSMTVGTKFPTKPPLRYLEEGLVSPHWLVWTRFTKDHQKVVLFFISTLLVSYRSPHWQSKL